MATPRIRKRKSGNALNVNFENIVDEIRKDMVSHMADAVKDGFEQIVTETPVDTGYARSSWTVLFQGVKSPEVIKKDLNAVYPGVEAIMAREELKFQFIRKSGFGMGFRFNNVAPYIYVLENSHSSKKDFVKRGMMKMKIALESSMKKRGRK